MHYIILLGLFAACISIFHLKSNPTVCGRYALTSKGLSDLILDMKSFSGGDLLRGRRFQHDESRIDLERKADLFTGCQRWDNKKKRLRFEYRSLFGIQPEFNSATRAAQTVPCEVYTHNLFSLKKNNSTTGMWTWSWTTRNEKLSRLSSGSSWHLSQASFARLLCVRLFWTFTCQSWVNERAREKTDTNLLFMI